MFSSKLYWNNRPKRKQLTETSIKVSIPDTTSLWHVDNELGIIQETAPNLFRKVSGDFKMNVKICGFHKYMKSMHDQAGLVIRESKTVYMRYGIELCAKPSMDRNKCHELEPCIRPVIVKNEIIDNSSCIPLTEQEQKNDMYWFQVKRKNGVMTASCSSDGITYKVVRRARLSGNEDRVSVGLYGANPLGPNGFKIIYEDFSIVESETNPLSETKTAAGTLPEIQAPKTPTSKTRRTSSGLRSSPSKRNSSIKELTKSNFENWKTTRSSLVTLSC